MSKVSKNVPKKSKGQLEEPGFFKRWFFLFTNKLINLGATKTITSEDFWDCLPIINNDKNVAGLQAIIKKHPKASFYEQIKKHINFPYFFPGDFFMALAYIMQIPIPYLIKSLLDWLEDPIALSWHGWAFTAGLVICGMGRPVSFMQGFYLKLISASQLELAIRVKMPL